MSVSHISRTLSKYQGESISFRICLKTVIEQFIEQFIEPKGNHKGYFIFDIFVFKILISDVST